MITDLLVTVESWGPVVALGNSVLAYPLVNAAHVLGIALLVGGILPLDIRLAGLWRDATLAPLWHVLSRTAGLGLALAVVSGGLLFATRAGEYVQSPLFLAKMGLVLLGGANAVVLSRLLAASPDFVTPAARLFALVSLTCWLGALLLGRLVGYF